MQGRPLRALGSFALIGERRASCFLDDALDPRKLVPWIDMFNAEVSPTRHSQGPRSQEVGFVPKMSAGWGWGGGRRGRDGINKPL